MHCTWIMQYLKARGLQCDTAVGLTCTLLMAVKTEAPNTDTERPVIPVGQSHDLLTTMLG